MTLKSGVASLIGKSTYHILHTFTNGGSSLPGKVAEKIDPAILKNLATNYEVIIITGTNGKTLTTALITNIFKTSGYRVLTNKTGSNMTQGIITSFLIGPENKGTKPVAILEVDEANVVKITQYIHPKVFVLTNIFRDQMDRYGEIYTTYDKILNGIANAPEATVIVNGDAPIFNSRKIPNPILYYGFNDQPDGETMAHYNTDGVLCPVCNHILHYKFLSYSNLGKYYCPNCGFQRPQLNYAMTKIEDMSPTSSTFTLDQTPITIGVGGKYNIYNALAAYAVGRFFKLPIDAIQTGLTDNDRIFGRQEVIDVDGKLVTLILVKNPVGLNQVLDMISLDQVPFTLATLLNANYADGIDTSWIWDGNFEDLPFDQIPQVITGGERRKDITFRMKVAGVIPENLLVQDSLPAVLAAIKKAPTEHVYVLATYTAILQLRKLMATDGYIKGGMA